MGRIVKVLSSPRFTRTSPEGETLPPFPAAAVIVYRSNRPSSSSSSQSSSSSLLAEEVYRIRVKVEKLSVRNSRV